MHVPLDRQHPYQRSSSARSTTPNGSEEYVGCPSQSRSPHEHVDITIGDPKRDDFLDFFFDVVLDLYPDLHPRFFDGSDPDSFFFAFDDDDATSTRAPSAWYDSDLGVTLANERLEP